MNTKTKRDYCLRAAALIVVSSLIAGCGGGKPAATQIAAKVNSDEISVHQINFVLSKAPNLTPERADQARREILDKLVEQQLAVQQATEKKLDRSPEVVAALDAARRDILTRAYYGQLVATVTQPTAEEVKKYYADHPQLFAQRRVYSLQEIAVPTATAPAKQLRELAAKSSMNDIAQWLKKENITFAVNTATRAAEQIPLPLLAKLHTVKDGQTAVIETPENVHVIRVVASQSAPVNEAAAQQQIQTYLSNLRAREAVTQNVQQLKEKARIEYVGEYAAAAPKPAAGTPAAPAAAGVPSAPTTAAAPAAAKPAEPAAAAKSDQLNVEKGLAGFK